MAMSLLVCDLASQHFSNAIVPVAREADFPDLGRRVPWIIRRDFSHMGSSAESKRCGVTEGVLRQNAILMHSLQKQPPKDRRLGPSLCASVSGS